MFEQLNTSTTGDTFRDWDIRTAIVAMKAMPRMPKRGHPDLTVSSDVYRKLREIARVGPLTQKETTMATLVGLEIEEMPWLLDGTLLGMSEAGKEFVRDVKSRSRKE